MTNDGMTNTAVQVRRSSLAGAEEGKPEACDTASGTLALRHAGAKSLLEERVSALAPA